MTTQVEYALLAANSYAVKDTVTSIENIIPIPDGWSILDFRINDPTGFTARAYQNTLTGEITIAYTGTTFEGAVNNVGDWLLGNITAGSGAALAPQVIDAAKFYLDILQANSGANITFTGHSLGGGLASLMALYFDRPATVFDEAPFEKSADSSIVSNGLKVALAAAGYTLPDAFAGYIALDPLAGAFIPSPSRVAREGNVSAIYLKDEILSLAQTATGRIALPLLFAWNPALFALSLNVANIAGSELPIDAHATNGNGWGIPLLNGDPVDLHYMPLLTAFLQSPEFLTVCQNNPEVLQKIFTSEWNVNPKTPQVQNFLNLMVQRQTLNETSLDAFAGDIGRIHGDLATSVLKAALVELGIDLQYVQGLDHVNGIAAGTFDPVFKPLTGGIQIEHKPEDDQWVSKGFAQLDRELRNAHPELFAISVDRYSLATQGDFVATAQDDGKHDLMLGGAGNDTLTGGDGSDLLIGGTGADTLDGGAGYDTYTLEGRDTIRDSDGQGILKDKAGNIISGVIEKRADGTYAYLNDPSASVTIDANLTLTLADGTIAVLENFTSGNLGLKLVDTVTQATTLITGDLAPIVYGTDSQGNPVYHYDALGNRIVDPGKPGAVDDILYGSSDGDQIIGGAGSDFVNGNDGADLIEGGTGADILAGGNGDDRLYAGSETGVADAIAAGNSQTGSGLKGDWLAGGAGDDAMVAGADEDVLSGGAGSDLLIAGAGNDYILGDADYVAQSFGWTVTPQAGIYDFQPAIGATDPAGSGSDIIYAGDGNDHAWAGGGADAVYGEGGNDTLDGGDGNDFMDGDAGNDILQGGAGNDILYGGAGDDALYGGGDSGNHLDGGDGNDSLTVNGSNNGLFGGAGDDTLAASGGYNYLDGGDGANTLTAKDGNNELFGGAGNDNLTADGGNNYLDGGDGTNTLAASGGNSQLFGGTGDDKLSASGGYNYLDGEDGNNTLTAMGGNNELFGGAGNDNLAADGGNNYLDGGEGDNTLGALGGNSQLFAGAGNDTLQGGGGNNYLDAGGGANTLIADGGGNTLLAGAGDDTLSSAGGNSHLDAGDGNNILIADGGGNTLVGGVGNDQIYAYGTGNTLNGGAGNDKLYGGDYSDTLAGGAGDDYLTGGAGNDLYIYNPGDGIDHIVDSSANGQINTLRFGAGINASDIVLSLGSLKLDMGSTSTGSGQVSNIIHIDNFDPSDAANSSSIQRFEFADGSFLSAQELLARGLSFNGTDGNDTLIGTSVADTLNGGNGNDTLQGGAGNDMYLFGKGAGQDTIYENDATAGNVDTIRMAGDVLPKDVVVKRDEHNLYFSFVGASGSMTVQNWFDGDAAKIEQVVFADGTVWDAAVLDAKVNPPPTNNADTLYGTGGDYAISGLDGDDTLYGLAGNDALNGGDGNDVLQGDAGNDLLDGSAGDDMLEGGEGNDSLAGGAGNDALVGSAGNDMLDGGAGDDGLSGGADNDTYLFGRGSGRDTIFDNETSGGSVNTIAMAAGVFPTDMVVSRDLYHITLGINNPDGTTDSVVLVNWFKSDDFKAAQVLFGDGTVWDVATLTAMANTPTEGADIVDGTAGNDVINGLSGNDQLYGVAGDDTLIGGAGNDKLMGDFNLASAPNTHKQGGNDYLIGGDGNDVILGGVGADTLDGGAGDDVLDGGTGDWRKDSIVGSGNDTYLFGKGYGHDMIIDTSGVDTVKMAADVLPADVIVNRSGNDLSLRLKNPDGTTDQLILRYWYQINGYKIEQVVFADGTTWNTAALEAMAKIPTEYSDYIWGTAGDDVFNGLGGDDVMRGFTGNDTLEGGVGNDMLEGGYGNDTLVGGAGDDRLFGGEEFNANNNGSNIFDGGAGNDVLTGSNRDFLRGWVDGTENLNDTYLFGRGYGQDEIRDFDNVYGNLDTVKMAAGLLPTDVTVTRDQSSLFLTINNPDGTADRLTIVGWFLGASSMYQSNRDAYKIEQVVFDDGTVWDMAVLEAMANEGNAPPILSAAIPNQTSTQDKAFTFQIPAGIFTDPDIYDNLTYSAKMADGSALPNWLVFNSAGIFKGTPTNLNVGNFNIAVTATDLVGQSATSTFSLNVINVNDAPVAKWNTGFALEDDGAVTISAASLLANDTDPDLIHGDSLSIVSVDKVASGAAVSLVNGAVKYDFGNHFQFLRAGQNTTDVFTYTIADSAGATSTALVNMAIYGANDAPVTNADAAAVLEDTILSASGNVLANDSDIEQSAMGGGVPPGMPPWLFNLFYPGAALSVANAGIYQGACGTLVLNANGSYTYTLDNASHAVQSLNEGQTVTETFAYQATDGMATTPSTLTVTITGTNDAPVTAADTAAVQEDGIVDASGNVLANDSGTALSVANAGSYQGALGSLLLNTDGSYTYSLDNALLGVQSLAEGQVVTEEFIYQATNGIATTPSSLTVSIVGINDAPVTAADTNTILEDIVISATGNVLGNDADADQGNILGVADAGLRRGSYGSLALATDGSYSYVLDNATLAVQSLAAGEAVVDSFSYQATDGLVNTPSILTIAINGANDAPVTSVDFAAAREDVTLTTNGNVLPNDTDIDHGTMLDVADAGIRAGSYGSLTLNADGSYSYTLDNSLQAVQSVAAGQTVTEAFAYQASDGIAGTTSTLTITIAGANDAPLVAADIATVQEDVTLTTSGNVLTNDSDIDQGAVLSVADAGIVAGNYGNLTMAADGSYSYIVDNTSVPVQSLGRMAQVAEHFGYTVTDGIVGVSSFLDVYLNGTNDTPILVTPLADQDFTFNKSFSWQMPSGSFTDIDQGDALDYTATLADGSSLPDWLRFDTVTQTFYGITPKTIGYVDIRLTATDRLAVTGSTVGSLATSDAFRISISHGNQGVGNGQDAAPAGLVANFNDGVGTSPGNPGAPDLRNDILYGDSGNNTLTGTPGNELFIGGTGNDTITTSTGADVIAFNQGGGQDTVVSSTGADNTLSLGGGIDYQNLAMSKTGNDLILAAGPSTGSGQVHDQITLQNWFSSTTNHSIANLQIVLDASAYDANSSDPLLNHQVQSFDFAALAQNFDQALAANPALTAWSLTDSLLNAHLAGSDTAALGGDLAYQYNLNGTLAGIGVAPAQAVLGDANFGVAPQLLQPLSGLQTGAARLG